MSIKTNQVSRITSVILGFAIALLALPLPALFFVDPQAIQSAISDLSPALSGLLVGVIGALAAKSNLDFRRFSESVSPRESDSSAAETETSEELSPLAKFVFFMSAFMVVMSAVMIGFIVFRKFF